MSQGDPTKPRSERQRTFLFVLCGGLNTVLAAAVYFALKDWVGFNKDVSLVGDYAFGLALGYVLNRYVTFGDISGHKKSFSKYMVAGILYFLTHWALLNVCTELLGMDDNWGFLASFVVTFGAFYVAQKLWVFRPHD